MRACPHGLRDCLQKTQRRHGRSDERLLPAPRLTGANIVTHHVVAPDTDGARFEELRIQTIASARQIVNILEGPLNEKSLADLGGMMALAGIAGDAATSARNLCNCPAL
jgi:hypothetical protein